MNIDENNNCDMRYHMILQSILHAFQPARNLIRVLSVSEERPKTIRMIKNKEMQQ
jgi:hypothetical protein